MPVMVLDPGTAAQIAFTSFVGPPIKVVPVSIAESADDPVVIDTLLPCTVTPTHKNQKYNQHPSRHPTYC